MSEQAEQAVHTVTLRFTGPQSEEMAKHFFSSWVDGELSQTYAEALDDSDIAEAIQYDGDEETLTLTIEATQADDDEEEEEDEVEDTVEDAEETDTSLGDVDTVEGEPA